MPAPRWLARFNLHVTNRLVGPLARHMPGMGGAVHVGRKNDCRECCISMIHAETFQGTRKTKEPA